MKLLGLTCGAQHEGLSHTAWDSFEVCEPRNIAGPQRATYIERIVEVRVTARHCFRGLLKLFVSSNEDRIALVKNVLNSHGMSIYL